MAGMATPLAGDSLPVVDAAVGILFNKCEGVMLMCKRPSGKPFAGYWEFPGGKMEAGESVRETLRRELAEELGISVQVDSDSITEAFTIEHEYPAFCARLHVFLVSVWSGEVYGAEGQEIRWVRNLPYNKHEVEPILPGTIRMLEKLATIV